MKVDKKLLDFEEVSLHNKARDCWVIVNAKVYDVTTYLEDHPGGDEVLLAAAGKDASEEFEEAGHGSAARLMLDELYVAEIDPSTMPETAMTNQNVDLKEPENVKAHVYPNCITKNLRFLIAFTILVSAIGICLYA